MSGVIVAREPPSTTAPVESESPTSEGSGAGNANNEKGTGLTNNISLAQKLREALGKEPDEYQVYSLKGFQTKEEGATNLLSVVNAAYKVLYLNINDIREWRQVYGAAPAVVLAIFGRKSVWKMQAELLGRPGRPSPGDSGDPYDPDDPDGPGGAWGRRGMNDPAAEEYKRTIEAEILRIGVAGTIIASIAVIALTLPSLSQTHWVARASWIFSLISSLLAVFYGNNQVLTLGYLLLGNRVRAWIRGSSKGPHDHIKENNNLQNVAKLLVRSLVPAPSSVLIVSAPGLLLSASLYFLLIGFGVYLGFMWTRALDDLAGPDDNRDVFIIYLVSLIFCYGVYSMSDAAHDTHVTDPVGGIIQDNLTKLVTRYNMFERRHKERSKETENNLKSEQRLEERRAMAEKRLVLQTDLSMEILKELREIKELMKPKNIGTSPEDSY